MSNYNPSRTISGHSDIYTPEDLAVYWVRHNDHLSDTTIYQNILRSEVRLNKYASERTMSAAISDYIKYAEHATRQEFYDTYTFTRSMATAVKRICSPELQKTVGKYVCGLLFVDGDWEQLLKEVAEAEPVLWQRAMSKIIDICSPEMKVVCYDENMPGHECVVVKKQQV